MVSPARLDVSVVLPTYNESASLPVLVPRIGAALEAAGLNGEIIVVDDNSPDGTAEVARGLAERFPMQVLKRTEERGLATAVLRGFDMSRAEVCVVMDADGSHPVEALGSMVQLILDDKAEIVVGSRHVAGGGSSDWPLFSRFKSRFAASLALGLTSMTDPTTGFMAIRRALLPDLKLDPVGWKIVLEIVVKAHPARLAEVPIIFTDREHGESKQSLRVLGEYFSHLYKLYKFRFPALIEFVKFCLVGLAGLFVDLSILALLKELASLDTRLCQVFGFVAAVTFNFAVNRRFSFENARQTPLLGSYLAYVGANLVGLTLRMLVIQALLSATDLDRGRGYLLVSVIGILVATLVNFVGVKYFAFATPQAARGDASVRLSSEPPSPSADPPTRRAVALLALLGCLAFYGITSSFQLPRTHDEHVNQVMADNIRRGFEGLLHPATVPNFAGDWRAEALPLLGNTPVYPLLLAAFSHFGELGRSALLLLTLALCLFAVHAAVSPVSGSGARTSVLLLLTSPWLLAAFSLREFEPLVCSLGALSFAALLRAKGARAARWALLSGALLGLGFTVKMWLITPAVFAALGFIVARAYTLPEAQLKQLPWITASLMGGFAAFAALHLLFVAVVAPSDIDAWIQWVYLGLFSGRGISAQKLSAAADDSRWAYLGFLLRDHGVLLVPIALGLASLTRRLGSLQRAWFAGVGFAVLGLVPLSVPAAKEPLYMTPALPFLYGFAALCLLAPDYTPARYVRVDRAAAKLSIALAAALVMSAIVRVLSAHTQPLLLLALQCAHVAIWTVPSFRVLQRRPIKPAIVPCAMLSLLVALSLIASGLGTRIG